MADPKSSNEEIVAAGRRLEEQNKRVSTQVEASCTDDFETLIVGFLWK